MIILSLILLVVAVTINTALVWLHRRRRITGYTESTHTLAITPGWVLFVLSLVAVGIAPVFPFVSTQLSVAAGAVLAVMSCGLFIYVITLLGTGSLVNRNLFVPQPFIDHRLFRIHPNPMYVSYTLGIAALGLLFGVADYFIIAGFCYILLNYVEARVERP